MGLELGKFCQVYAGLDEGIEGSVVCGVWDALLADQGGCVLGEEA